MKCKNCGAEITDDSVFCEFCGKKTTKKNFKPFLWVGGIVAVIAIALIIVLSQFGGNAEAIFNRLNEQEQEQTKFDCNTGMLVVENGTTTDGYVALREKLASHHSVEIEVRNLATVYINREGRTLVNGEFIDDIDQLKSRLKDFLGNPNDLSELPAKEGKSICFNEGETPSTFYVSKGVISFQPSKKAKSNSDNVRDAIYQAIYELRDELSQIKYNTPFRELTDEYKSLRIREAIPFAIVETKDCSDDKYEQEVQTRKSDGWHESEVQTRKDEILSKAREAGQAKCNCYKNDPVAIESCFRPILEENFAAYKDDANFQAEMDAEYKRCIRGE